MKKPYLCSVTTLIKSMLLALTCQSDTRQYLFCLVPLKNSKISLVLDKMSDPCCVQQELSQYINHKTIRGNEAKQQVV